MKKATFITATVLIALSTLSNANAARQGPETGAYPPQGDMEWKPKAVVRQLQGENWILVAPPEMVLVQRHLNGNLVDATLRDDGQVVELPDGLLREAGSPEDGLTGMAPDDRPTGTINAQMRSINNAITRLNRELGVRDNTPSCVTIVYLGTDKQITANDINEIERLCEAATGKRMAANPNTQVVPTSCNVAIPVNATFSQGVVQRVAGIQNVQLSNFQRTEGAFTFTPYSPPQ
ncbi:MAG: hypothetical protein LBJ69_03695 [Holosporales bacterium]|jgi:hypothetical protein|nr:hypothetical protein [Holosporales bacterium]